MQHTSHWAEWFILYNRKKITEAKRGTVCETITLLSFCFLFFTEQCATVYVFFLEVLPFVRTFPSMKREAASFANSRIVAELYVDAGPYGINKSKMRFVEDSRSC